MLVDYHLHSHFSKDSKTTLKAICHAAVQANLTEIAITDHVDYTYPHTNLGHEINDLDQYFSAIAQCRQDYAGQLIIRAGVEIGLEQHRIADYEKLLTHPFDFVIGSLHSVQGEGVSHAAYFAGKTKEEAYITYYQTMLEQIRCFDQFDVLGHLDYCKRYGPYLYEENDYLIGNDLVQEILKTLIQRGIGIEVNTSGYRHVSHAPLPHPYILKQYCQLGGRRITIGSDSHRSEHVGYQIAETMDLLRSIGFSSISTFIGRQEKPLPF